MAKRTIKKRVKMTKFERLIYTFALVLAISAPLTIVFWVIETEGDKIE